MSVFKSTLLKNIFYLSLIQGSSFLIPLVLLPYLIRVLGAEIYGKLIFYQVIFLYACAIIDFGFNFSSTQDIARKQNDRSYINAIFSVTLICKSLILLISVIISFIYFYYLNNNRDDSYLFWCFIPQLFGYAFLPLWLFQGIEKTNIIAICTIAARLFTTIITFMVVKDSDDLYLAAFLQSITFTITAVLSLLYVYLKRIASIERVSINDIYLSFRNSFPFFISVFSVNLYTTLPAIVIGIVLGNVSVAYYNIALTIRNALLGLFNPISQSLFPRINSLYVNNRCEAYKLIKRSLVIVAVIFIGLALSINILAGFIVHKILGHPENIVVSLVQIICFLPAISAINNILGVQTIILHGYKKLFSGITIFYGVLNCIIIYPSLIYFSISGAIYSSLAIELFVFMTLAFIVIHKKLLSVAHLTR